MCPVVTDNFNYHDDLSVLHPTLFYRFGDFQAVIFLRPFLGCVFLHPKWYLTVIGFVQNVILKKFQNKSSDKSILKVKFYHTLLILLFILIFLFVLRKQFSFK
jgi:hypothetical protein